MGTVSPGRFWVPAERYTPPAGHSLADPASLEAPNGHGSGPHDEMTSPPESNRR